MSTLDLRREARQHMPQVECLPSLQQAAIFTWRGRMINEHGSANVFEGLAIQLEAAGVAQKIVAECRGFADEERRHGVLCGAVVEALGGEAQAEIKAPEVFPGHK